MWIPDLSLIRHFTKYFTRIPYSSSLGQSFSNQRAKRELWMRWNTDRPPPPHSLAPRLSGSQGVCHTNNHFMCATTQQSLETSLSHAVSRWQRAGAGSSLPLDDLGLTTNSVVLTILLQRQWRHSPPKGPQRITPEHRGAASPTPHRCTEREAKLSGDRTAEMLPDSHRASERFPAVSAYNHFKAEV